MSLQISAANLQSIVLHFVDASCWCNYYTIIIIIIIIIFFLNKEREATIKLWIRFAPRIYSHNTKYIFFFN